MTRLRWLLAAPLILVAAGGTVLSSFQQDMVLSPGGTFNGNTLLVGIGSGAFFDPHGPKDEVWTITDRGPNGDHPDGSSKVFPVPSFTPTIYRIKIKKDRYQLVQEIPIRDAGGTPITGLPTPGTEKAFLGDNVPGGPFTPLGSDPEGLDTEAIVRLKDGSFWIGEEYWGLVKIDKHGRIVRRIVPAGSEPTMAGAGYPVEGALPAVLAKRRLNRGIESLALSADEQHLYAIYQNPLDNPSNAARNNGNVRIFKLRIDGDTVAPVGEWVYLLDAGSSFGRVVDGVLRGDPVTSRIRDVKISELVCVGDDQLVVLERLEKTTKLYFIDLNDGATDILGTWDVLGGTMAGTPPTLQHLELVVDLSAVGVAPLGKRLLFNSLDDAPALPAKQESLAYFGGGSFLLINDNDFSVNGDKTRLTRLFIDPALLD